MAPLFPFSLPTKCQESFDLLLVFWNSSVCETKFIHRDNLPRPRLNSMIVVMKIPLNGPHVKLHLLPNEGPEETINVRIQKFLIHGFTFLKRSIVFRGPVPAFKCFTCLCMKYYNEINYLGRNITSTGSILLLLI